jgi:hypothetical protein
MVAMRAVTLGERASRVLSRVAPSVGLESRSPEMLGLLERVAASWFSRPVTARAQSIHTLDGSPLELSVPAGGAAELRFTVEPQRAPFDVHANWVAGRETLDAMVSVDGVSLAPLQDLLEGFTPRRDDKVGFAMWLGVVLRAQQAPMFKLYLGADPRAVEGERWDTLLSPILGRDTIEAVRDAVGPHSHVGIVAFDLASDARARVKLYVGHAAFGPRVGAVDLAAVERVERLGKRSRAGDARALIDHFAPEAIDPSSRLPVFVSSTIHVMEREIDRITTNVQFLPFGPDPAPVDEVKLSRAEAAMSALGADGGEALRRFITDVRGEHDARTPVLTYFSVQREGTRPRFTAYASPRLYDGAP